MKLPLIDRSAVSPAEVVRIWDEYHRDRPSTIATTLEPWRIARILALAKANPMFMFPIDRPGGFFSVVSQFQHNCCLMTTLDQFRNPGTVPSLTVTFYDDLCQTKGVGLLRADIVSIVTASEARDLVDRLLHYYSSAEFGLVRDFNQRPRDFDLDRYIADSRARWPLASSPTSTRSDA